MAQRFQIVRYERSQDGTSVECEVADGRHVVQVHTGERFAAAEHVLWDGRHSIRKGNVGHLCVRENIIGERDAAMKSRRKSRKAAFLEGPGADGGQCGR